VVPLAFWAALIVSALPRLHTSVQSASHQTASGDRALVQALRLGAVLGTSGWSAATRDLNVDGTPDVVTTEHAVRRAGGYPYRIQFSVSGLAPAAFAFESADAAINIRIADVDRDNDLDVVVNSVLSREVVGVWLNDGAGGFQAVDASGFASEVTPRHSVQALGPSASPRTAGLPAPRSADGLPARVYAGHNPSHRSAIAVQTGRLCSDHRFAAATPRGPPSFLS
jgi:hypothetical protein